MLREPNDLSVPATAPGPGAEANEANVGGGETSDSGWLHSVVVIMGGGWDRAGWEYCGLEKTGDPDSEGERSSVPFCFLLNSLLNKLRLPDAVPETGVAGGDIIAKDMDEGGADGIGVGLLLELEIELE